MKKEEMDLKTLERLSMDETIRVPSGLDESLDQLVDDLAATEGILSAGRGAVISEPEKGRAPGKKIWRRTIGLAAGFLLIFGVQTIMDFYVRPQDTYTDPQQAYDEIEKVFELISEKMSPAAEELAELDGKIQDRMEILKKDFRR